MVVHLFGGRAGLKHLKRFGLGLLAFLKGDEAVAIHLLQNVVRALFALLRGVANVVIRAGIIAIGILDQAREHGAFLQRKLAQILAEVILRGGLYAVQRAAHVDDVHVFHKDALLGRARVAGKQARQRFFQPQREIGFLHLALVGLFAGKQRLLDQLAGDRAAALVVAGEQVAHQRAQITVHVHAAVLPEMRVLGGNHGVDQILRKLVIRAIHAVFRSAEGSDQVAVLVVDEGRLRLRVEKIQIEVGRRVHPCLRDAHHKTRGRKANDQNQNHQHLHRGHEHGQDEISIAVARHKQRILLAHEALRKVYIKPSIV